jgi:threonine/homoserine/homoserine lactone efflux protein
MEAFLTGVASGYGIAIPVGAIAVLIVDVGIRSGFRHAFFAGAGAATADFLYAGLAVVGGTALAGVVDSVDQPLRYLSGAVLIAIAVLGLRRIGKQEQSIEYSYPDRTKFAGIYARFVGLTIINPTTIVYFAAVIVGLGVASEMTARQGVFFSTGAFIASLSWQTVLAAVGSLAGSRLSNRAQMAAVVLGNLVILAFAIVILFR